VNNW